MLFEGLAGRFAQRISGTIAATLTGLTSLRVAQVEGDGDEAGRAGLRFFLSGRTATGIAPTQANPTTAAQWLLYNPTGNTVTAFIDMLGVDLASGTAGAGGSLLVAPIGPANIPTTVPTVSSTNILIQNMNPLGGRRSSLICVASQTLVNTIASNWWPVAVMAQIGTLLGQVQMMNWDIKGKIFIPPNCGLGFNVISPSGTSPLWTPQAIWREYAADME